MICIMYYLNKNTLEKYYVNTGPNIAINLIDLPNFILLTFFRIGYKN